MLRDSPNEHLSNEVPKSNWQLAKETSSPKMLPLKRTSLPKVEPSKRERSPKVAPTSLQLCPNSAPAKKAFQNFASLKSAPFPNLNPAKSSDSDEKSSPLKSAKFLYVPCHSPRTLNSLIPLVSATPRQRQTLIPRDATRVRNRDCMPISAVCRRRRFFHDLIRHSGTAAPQSPASLPAPGRPCGAPDQCGATTSR